MKTKFRLLTGTAVMILALAPFAPALGQAPSATGGVSNAEKTGKPGETSTTPSRQVQSSSGISGNAGGVSNAEKSGKPGESSTTPRTSASTTQGSHAGSSSADGVTNADKSGKPGETSSMKR